MSSRLLLGAALAATMLAAAPACSRNPATGKLQFALISEPEEIKLGQQGDAQIRDALGEYGESPEATALVVEIGKKLAAGSERPDLPWTFRVLDDPGVNAFALPGGYLYVTRGLLAHLNSEDELAAVIGHEIGHVSARHGAVQLRKTAVAQASVGLFRVVDPNLRHVGGIAARSAGLALLRYSRDDEHEADDLSVRYVSRGGYDPNAIVEVFRVLASITSSQEGQRVPTWMSTHPEPEERMRRMQESLRGKGVAVTRPQPEAEYLRRVEGMVVGEDPRKGFFLGRTFVHPRTAFRIDLPEGWEAAHADDQLLALSSDKKALFVLTPSEAESSNKAIAEFFSDGTLQRGEGWTGQVGGFPTESAAFAVGEGSERLAGLVAFIDYSGRVFVMLAIGPESDWVKRADAIAQTFASFRALTEAALLDVPPMRVVLVTLDADTTLAQLEKSKPSAIPLAEIARLNHVAADEKLAKGRIVKRVEGFNPVRVGGAS